MCIVLIVGPSGSGKTTLIRNLVALYPDYYEKIVSLSTRIPRIGEVHAVDYEFVSIETFERERCDLLLVRNENSGIYYGTRRSSLQQGSKTKLLSSDVGAVKVLLEEGERDIILIVLRISDEQKRFRMELRGDHPDDMDKRISQEASKTYVNTQPVRSFVFDASVPENVLAQQVHAVLTL